MDQHCPHLKTKANPCDDDLTYCCKDRDGREYDNAQQCQGDPRRCVASQPPAITILGADGYLGWSAVQYFRSKGWRVSGIDNGLRRIVVEESGGDSLTPILSWRERTEEADADLVGVDMRNYDQLRDHLAAHPPDAILHLAELPSAPYSMRGPDECALTAEVNVVGSLNLLWAMREVCPEAHLIKLGTMGEYGVPPWDIPEGWATLTHRGREARVFTPFDPGSLYHATKCADSINIRKCCDWWGFRSTDIMQGPVYGIRTSATGSTSPTRLDYDEAFGTAINRFVVQALVDYPLTVYGEGGQTRGYLTLEDSMEAMWLLACNPPEQGEYRVANQFVDWWTINELAEAVRDAARDELGKSVTITSVPNPRVEQEQHYYAPIREVLPSLGWEGTELREGIRRMIVDVAPFADRAIREVIAPTTNWRRG